MIATVVDTKMCPECCKPFHRGPNHSRREWASRKFCSIPCAVAGKGHSHPIPLPSQKWMGSAACHDSLLEFVPDSKVEALPALGACQGSGCPVTRECLAFGRATRAHGVWGGKFLRYGKVT
jgi:hypothetical protein